MNEVTKYENLSSEEFERRLNESMDTILLDVRTAGEFQNKKIPNAINLDVTENDFLSKVAGLDKSRTYFIYCRSGGRSGQACTLMAREGFTVFNLAGGILDWKGRTV